MDYDKLNSAKVFRKAKYFLREVYSSGFPIFTLTLLLKMYGINVF